MVGAKDERIARADGGADRGAEGELRLELRLAEVERRLSMDSEDSGTPSWKERSGRRRRGGRGRIPAGAQKDRKRGGQPGHQGKGLKRDPDPGEAKTAEPPAGAVPARRSWTARRPWSRGGRRSSTRRSSGR